MHNLRQYEVPLQRYMAMMDLQVNLVVYSLLVLDIIVECRFIKMVAHKN